MRCPSTPTSLALATVAALASSSGVEGFVHPSSHRSAVLGGATARSRVPPAATSVEAEAPAIPENPRLSGLALALDDGTRKSHSVAQNSAFVQGFFKGISSPDSYKNLLTSLYYVYKAMEEDVLDRVEPESVVGKLDDAPLRRLAGLEKDMEYFYGSDWRTTMAPPSQATRVYVDRILEIAARAIPEPAGSDENEESETSPPEPSTASASTLYLFVAHQYTRYLGDLFGGQMMGGMATRSMGLPSDGSGTAFYTFESIDSTKDFITDWYARLNALGLSEAQMQEIVDEANLVFDLNIGILEELEGSPWAALWTLFLSRAKEFTDWSNIKESKNGV